MVNINKREFLAASIRCDEALRLRKEGENWRSERRQNAGMSNAARRKALVGALRELFGDRAEVGGANAGLHVFAWLKGKGGGPIRDACGRAEKAGIGLYTADPFYARPPDRTAILLGYAPLRERDIREGIRRLAAALR